MDNKLTTELLPIKEESFSIEEKVKEIEHKLDVLFSMIHSIKIELFTENNELNIRRIKLEKERKENELKELENKKTEFWHDAHITDYERYFGGIK